MGGAVDLWEQADEEKLAELILYIAERIEDDPTGGATKINKILYFSEFAHVRAHGAPITGVRYQKLPRGPAPRRLRPIRDQLIANGDAELRIDTYFGYPLHRLVAKRRADPSRFEQSERDTVDQVIDALRGKTADEVSKMSHRDKAWDIVDLYDDIPFASAFLASESVVTKATRNHAEELAERLGITV